MVVSVVVGGAGSAGDAGNEGVFRGWLFVVVVVLVEATKKKLAKNKKIREKKNTPIARDIRVSSPHLSSVVAVVVAAVVELWWS